MESCIRYGFLLLDHVASQDPLSVSVAILHQFNILPDMYQVGFTKLFFRTGQVRNTIMTPIISPAPIFLASVPFLVCTSIGLLIVNLINLCKSIICDHESLFNATSNTSLPTNILYCTIEAHTSLCNDLILSSGLTQDSLVHYFV